MRPSRSPQRRFGRQRAPGRESPTASRARRHRGTLDREESALATISREGKPIEAAFADGAPEEVGDTRPRGPGSHGRVLVVLVHPGTHYEPLAARIADELTRLGFDTVSCRLPIDALQPALAGGRPRFLVSNSLHPHLALLARRLDIPYLAWEFDKVLNLERFAAGSLSQHTVVLTSYRGDVERFRAAGARAHFLPSITDADVLQEKIDPALLAPYVCDIAFVGTPAIATSELPEMRRQLAALSQDGTDSVRDAIDALDAVIDTALARQRIDTALNRWRLPEIVDEEMARRPAIGALAFPRDMLVHALAKQCCAEQRAGHLAALAPLGGVDVYGPPEWRAMSVPGVRWRGPARFVDEAPLIYRAAKINLDLTRIYQLDGWSDRVFNVLANGGFLIANRTESIADCFEAGRELVLIDTPRELADACAHYLAREDERHAIAARGRERVRRDHTLAGRLRAMLELAGIDLR